MRLLTFVFVFFVMGYQSFAQGNNDVLAKIGDKVITVNEFKYRYEFTPQINRKYSDKGKAKEELLYTLIAEKLFATDAERRGFDTLQAMKMNYVPLEKMHVRDALYKKEISDRVKFNEGKFNEGLHLANFKLFVDYVYAKGKKQIDDAYNLLTSSPKFDSIAATIKDAEYVSEPYEVTYGKMNYKAEEAIYSLRINEFSKPVESPDGWYIFRLISKIPADYNSVDQKRSMVNKVVESRIEDSIYTDFWRDFFSKQKVNTDGPLFWYFAEETQKLISQIKKEQNIEDKKKIEITNEDFIHLRNSLSPDSLNKTFIKFKENPETLGEFLSDFAFEGFYTFTTDMNKIAAQLSSRVKRQIELELIARDGYKRGMESLPEVRSSTDIWRDNYLSTLNFKDVVKNIKITKEDIKEFVDNEKADSIRETEVNIIEILTDSLEVVKEAFKLTNNNKTFKKYAGLHTKRKETKNNGGEFGFFSVSDHGEIGKIAESMEVGDVYGPLQTDNGYSIFKLIAKKQNKIDINKSDISKSVVAKIKYKKVMDYLESKAVALAEKYKVTINKGILNSLNLTNLQMVVFRYMGFGGRIQAYPYSTPFFKWKEKWEQKKKDLL